MPRVQNKLQNNNNNITAIVQAWHFSLFGHMVRMPDETRRPRTTWMKTIQQDLKCNNLSLTEAIDVAQNCPLWRLTSAFGATHSQWCLPHKK